MIILFFPVFAIKVSIYIEFIKQKNNFLIKYILSDYEIESFDRDSRVFT